MASHVVCNAMISTLRYAGSLQADKRPQPSRQGADGIVSKAFLPRGSILGSEVFGWVTRRIGRHPNWPESEVRNSSLRDDGLWWLDRCTGILDALTI